MGAVATDPITTYGSDRFEEVGRMRQVASAGGQLRNPPRKLHDRDLAKARRLSVNPIEAARSTQRLVPHGKRLLLGL
jgi:hypothetical protein